MTPLNLELGLSQSTSLATRAGGGDIQVFGGGARQTQTLYIVAAVIAVAVVAAVFFWRKR